MSTTLASPGFLSGIEGPHWSSDPPNSYFKLIGRHSFSFYFTSFSMYERYQKYPASRFAGGSNGATPALAPPGPPGKAGKHFNTDSTAKKPSFPSKQIAIQSF